MTLGDDFDRVVDDLYGGLIVNRVSRHWYSGRPFLQVRQGVIREALVIQVRRQREIDQSQRFVAADWRVMAIVGLSEVGGHHHAPRAYPHVDRLNPQRGQEICESGLPHPVAEIKGTAAPNQQSISLLNRRDPMFFFYAA